MPVYDSRDLDLNISRARVVLSLMALVSWWIDPAYDSAFSMDFHSLILLLAHLAYSLIVLFLGRRGVASGRLTAPIDVLFAGAVTVITEGPTSPSWLFFVFAIIAVDCRTGFREAIAVTLCSSVLYFLLLLFVASGLKNEYLMRAGYLAIVGYLIGFFGQQRAQYEARARELENMHERQAIARSLHDDYVQALAGVNLRLQTCRTLIQRQQEAQALVQMTELQAGVAREYDAVRAFIRSLADVRKATTRHDSSPPAGTRFEIGAAFTAPARVAEQIIQIMLEGLRNTWRHGNAGSASINVIETGAVIRISIDDDGVGLDDPADLPWTIASRVAECGGQLRIAGDYGPGLHLQVELPSSPA